MRSGRRDVRVDMVPPRPSLRLGWPHGPDGRGSGGALGGSRLHFFTPSLRRISCRCEPNALLTLRSTATRASSCRTARRLSWSGGLASRRSSSAGSLSAREIASNGLHGVGHRGPPACPPLVDVTGVGLGGRGPPTWPPLVDVTGDGLTGGLGGGLTGGLGGVPFLAPIAATWCAGPRLRSAGSIAGPHPARPVAGRGAAASGGCRTAAGSRGPCGVPRSKPTTLLPLGRSGPSCLGSCRLLVVCWVTASIPNVRSGASLPTGGDQSARTGRQAPLRSSRGPARGEDP